MTAAAHDHRMPNEGPSITALPKVSLHDHLDGGLRPGTVLELAAEHGVALPAADADALARWFVESSSSGSLESYLETFDLVVAVLQTAPALTRVAHEAVLDLAADGVVHAELRWAPEQHLRQGLDLDGAVRAVQAGLDAAVAELAAAGTTISVGQLLSAMRQGDRSLDVARTALAHRDSGVLGFDLAGPEDGFPASDHREALDLLAAEFFPVTLHAGEAAGLDSIRGALVDGRALRLGHGVRLAEDVRVVESGPDRTTVELGPIASWVRDREIALEVSPSSNLQTGATAQWGPDLDDHPVDLLHQLGYRVTVNTDNRLMSGTSLSRELALLVQAFDHDLDDLETFQLDAAAAAFLPLEERALLAERIREGFDEARS